MLTKFKQIYKHRYHIRTSFIHSTTGNEAKDWEEEKTKTLGKVLTNQCHIERLPGQKSLILDIQNTTVNLKYNW